MSKVIKEFWVSDDFINDNHAVSNFILSCKATRVYKSKVTVTYEIDREVTVKESDIDKLLDGVAFSSKDISIIKKKLFGGGENE